MRRLGVFMLVLAIGLVAAMACGDGEVAAPIVVEKEVIKEVEVPVVVEKEVVKVVEKEVPVEVERIVEVEGTSGGGETGDHRGDFDCHPNPHPQARCCGSG